MTSSIQRGASDRRRRGLARRALLIALVVVIALIIGGIIATPTILSGVAGGIIERSLNDEIAGRVEVTNVSLSWTGPQRIGSIVLKDPDGSEVATVSAEADAGMLDLALGSRDLGMVRVRGLLDLRHTANDDLNLASAITGAGDEPLVVTPGAGPPGAKPSGTTEEVSLPAGLAFEIDASDLEVRYSPRDGAAGPIGFKVVKGEGRFAVGRPVGFELVAETLDGREALRVDFQADRLTDERGVLTLAESSMDLSIEGLVSASEAELLAGMLASGAGEGVSIGPSSDGGVLLEAKLTARDGRLTLTNADVPARVVGRVPSTLLRAVPTGDARVTIDTAPRFTVELAQLDIPLPASGSLYDADWRDAIVVATLATDEVSGSVAVDGAEAKRFRVESVQGQLRPMDRLFGLIFASTIGATFDGVETGTIEIDVRAAGLLDTEGRLRIGPFAPGGEDEYTLIPGPEYLRAVVRVQDFPSVMLQPLAEPAGISLERVMGPTIALDLRSGVRQGTGELPTEVAVVDGETMELPPVGEPYLAMTLRSEKTTAWVDLILQADRLKTRNKGIEIHTEAAVEVIRAVLPEDGPTITGEGSGIIELVDLDIPMGQTGPDLSLARGQYRIVLGRMGVQKSPDSPPVWIESIDAAIELSRSEASTWGIDARASYEGERFAVVGNGEVTGLTSGGSGGGWYGLSARTARPTGTLRILEVPTRLASLVSDRAREVAAAAVGDEIGGKIDLKPAGSDEVRFDIAIDGSGGVVQGGFAAGSRQITFDETGLMITLFEPGRLLNSLAASGAERPALVFGDSGQATLTLRDTTLSLDAISAGRPLEGAVASMRLGATDLRGSVAAGERTETFELSSVNATASLEPAGDLAVQVWTPDDSPDRFHVDLTITDFIDASGFPALDLVRVTSTAGSDLSASLVDALVSADGTLAGVIGPRLVANVRTDSLSLRPPMGSVSATHGSSYSEFSLEARMAQGPDGPVLEATGPATAKIMRLTHEASKDVLGVLFPLFASFEKSEQDEPAEIEARGLTLPADGNTRSLNGVLTVDPGTIRFETSWILAGILEATGNRAVGQMGHKLEQIEIRFERGVARYEDVIIPVGEFDLETGGVIDLNARTRDVYVIVPLDKLSDDLASLTRRNPLVGKLTRVPIRVRGPFEDPEITIDVEWLMQMLAENIVAPEGDGGEVEDLIRRGINDLFGGGDDEEKKDDK